MIIPRRLFSAAAFRNPESLATQLRRLLSSPSSSLSSTVSPYRTSLHAIAWPNTSSNGQVRIDNSCSTDVHVPNSQSGAASSRLGILRTVLLPHLQRQLKNLNWTLFRREYSSGSTRTGGLLLGCGCGGLSSVGVDCGGCGARFEGFYSAGDLNHWGKSQNINLGRPPRYYSSSRTANTNTEHNPLLQQLQPVEKIPIIRNITTGGRRSSSSTANIMSQSHVNFQEDTEIASLLARNEKWAESTAATHAELFEATGTAQHPKILWFGCSDSRVPETSLLDLCPGEVFVHRNIANVLPPNDLSYQCVLEFAVVHLKVKHIIVCGHYGCGGVIGAMSNQSLGILDMWLKNVKTVLAENSDELNSIPSEEDRQKRVVELNVITQAHGVLRMKNVQEAMKTRGLQVHGFVYDVACGRLKQVQIPEDKNEKLFAVQ